MNIAEAIKRAEKPEKAPPQQQSEIAHAVKKSLGGRYLYDEISGEWMTKGGVAWFVCRGSTVQRAIASSLETVRGGYSASYLSGVVTLLKLQLTAPEWTDDRHLLPFSNGVLDLRTNTFIPVNISTNKNPSESSKSSVVRPPAFGDPSEKSTNPSENWFFNWCLPYDYEPEAKCPTFEYWLNVTTDGDQDLIRFMLAWMVVVLRGRSDIQKYLELSGDGGTGKSTYLRICTLLVGEKNRTVTDLKNLENRFETANLYGKRLVQITDSAAYQGEVSTLKSITGGDPVRFEVKNKQAGEPFVFGGMVMTAANHVITSSDTSSGMSRRKASLFLKRRVTEAEKERFKPYGGIETLLEAEAPGIINYVLGIDEHDAVQTIKMPSGAIQRFKLESELQSNPILAWCDDSLAICERGKESQVGQKNDQPDRLYPHYRQWCDDQAREPVSLTKFSERVVDTLKSWDIETEKIRNNAGKTVLVGLRLKQSLEPLLISSEHLSEGSLKAGNPIYEDSEDSEGLESCSNLYASSKEGF